MIKSTLRKTQVYFKFSTNIRHRTVKGTQPTANSHTGAFCKDCKFTDSA